MFALALLPNLKAQHQHRVPLLTAIVLLDQALLGGGHSARCQSASTKAAKPAALISAVQLSPSDLSTPCCRYSKRVACLAGGASRGKGTRSFAAERLQHAEGQAGSAVPQRKPGASEAEASHCVESCFEAYRAHLRQPARAS